MLKENKKLAKFFNLAYQNFQRNNLDVAKSFCLKILEEQPNNFESIFLLGSIYTRIKNFNKAQEFLEKAISMRPNFIFSYNNLGNVFFESGKIKKAIYCYKKAIEIKPDYLIALNNLCVLLRNLKITDLDKIDQPSFKKIFLLLMKRNDIDHSDIFFNAKLFLFFGKNNKELEKWEKSNNLLLKNKKIKNFLKEELLLLMLQKSIITDQFLEKILTKLRYEILFTFFESKQLLAEDYSYFILSLSEQCFLNEYIFSKSDREGFLVKKLLIHQEKGQKIDELGLSILGCYIPLNNSETLKKKLLKYKSKNILFNDLISMQIKDPLKEKNLINSIQSFGKISDTVSKKVRKQYESNPYPRWRYTYSVGSSNFLQILNHQLKPNIVESKFKFKNPNLLIAGCGTGNHIFLTKEYSNVKILAIDLSLTSLAYAKRKIDELGIKNVDFLHADILELKNLGKKFDIIESIGTLHHMKNPEKGLKILLDLLEPHGFLKLGLYSKLARRHIVKVKDYAKKNNVKDIKIFRQMLISRSEDKDLSRIFDRADFYSTSSLKDLIFHVQEHTFTIPQLSKIFNKFNLEFLGFSNSLIKLKYNRIYNLDKKNINLSSWHQFEKDNPETFIGMYKFWVRKF